MSVTKKRILQFIDYKGISNREFCKKISVSPNLLSKNSAIGSDKLENIHQMYPELNMDWIITGRGEMQFKNQNNHKPIVMKNIDEDYNLRKNISYIRNKLGKSIFDFYKPYFQKDCESDEEYEINVTKYGYDFEEGNDTLHEGAISDIIGKYSVMFKIDNESIYNTILDENLKKELAKKTDSGSGGKKKAS